MHLIGKANWYLPRWLDRALPKVSIEHSDGVVDPDHSAPSTQNPGRPVPPAPPPPVTPSAGWR